MSERFTRTIPFACALLWSAGITLGLLTCGEPVTHSISAAIPGILMALGAGGMVFVADRRGQFPIGPGTILVLLLIVIGCFPVTDESLLLGTRFLSAWFGLIGAWALSCSYQHRGTILRLLFAVGGVLCLLGLAQTIYIRDSVREVYSALPHDVLPSLQTEKGAAFLDSWRASGTAINANAYAGLLLLLLASFAVVRSGTWAPVAWVGAFLCAGSLGATLAALIIFGVAYRKSKVGRLALVAFLASIILVVLAASGAWNTPWLESKVTSFRNRMDYAAQAFRVLGSQSPLGEGFGAFADLRFGVMRPGEGSSVWVHNTPLQLIIELGWGTLAMAGIVVAAVLSLRRGNGPRAVTPESSEVAAEASAGIASGAQWGMLLGAIASPWISGVMSFLPADVEFPLADSTICGGLAWGLFRLATSIPGPTATKKFLWMGIMAFAVHSLVDFDLYMPGVALVLCVVVAACFEYRQHSPLWTRVALAVCLCAPLGLMGIATMRFDADLKLRHLKDSPNPDSLAAVSAAPFRFEPLLSVLKTHPVDGPKLVLERWLALPDHLKARPLPTLLAARALSRLAAPTDQLVTWARVIHPPEEGPLVEEIELRRAEVLERAGASDRAEEIRRKLRGGR